MYLGAPPVHTFTNEIISHRMCVISDLLDNVKQFSKVSTDFYHHSNEQTYTHTSDLMRHFHFANQVILLFPYVWRHPHQAHCRPHQTPCPSGSLLHLISQQ